MSTFAPHTREKSGGSARSGSRKFKDLAPPIITPAPGEAGPSTQRRVRTVPRMSIPLITRLSLIIIASAAFEPTTPPSPARASNDSTLVDPSHPLETKRARRTRPKLRYSTSESSWDDTDEDGDGSDDEPPWWTFTQRGMHKMKLRSLKQKHLDSQELGLGPPIGAGQQEDSGKEGRISKPRKPIKRTSGNKTDNSIKKKQEKDDPTPRSSVKNMRLTDSPKPIRPPVLPANMRMSTPAFLRSKKDTTSGAVPTRIKMKRRYSAPSSPVPDEPIQSIEMVTSTLEGPARPVPLHASLPIPPVAHHSNLSRLSIPRPPFMKRNSGSVTDTEAVASQSVRMKAKRAQSRPLEEPQESGTSTPMRRQNVRRQTMAKLKIALPEHVTQHFAHGWPHAGSWQDALNGNYDEIAKDSSGASRRSSKDTKRQGSVPQTPRAMSLSPTAMGQASRGLGQSPTAMGMSRQASGLSPRSTGMSLRATGPITPRMDHGSDSASGSATPPVKRYKSKKHRRYRQAIAPPTPSGLGFTAAEKGHGRGDSWKQGRVVEEGFDWGNNFGTDRGHHRAITEEGDLTMDRTETMNEKVDGKQKDVKVKSKVKRTDGLDWKQRLRRKLFLDARVTIWIRFINLAVVICSLGLAVTIRKELFELRLPGLIGPSTTLVIAYSALTIIHIFIAVYREYFGRPIGLWGLRSKMLWVCLDLLFVALWSSALTLQINDLIDTPLNCVPQTAWWEEGKSSEYAALLNDLDVLRASSTDSQDSGVSDTLGIILPDVITSSSLAREACRRQEGGIALALMTLLLYGGNMVLSLFRIFETVRRTAHVDRAVNVMY